MGDNEQLQLSKPFFVIPPSLRKEVETQKQNLLDKIANAISKPWHIDHLGRICVDEVMDEDEAERMVALHIPFTASHGVLFRTNITAEDLFALRIKRNKKHYKPKFTL